MNEESVVIQVRPQGLKEKLAKWARFEDDGFGRWSRLEEPDPVTLIQKVTWGTLTKKLDFTHSFDACLNILVPEMDDPVCIELTRVTEGWVCMLASGIYAERETPALALCKAIEELIDEEAKHE